MSFVRLSTLRTKEYRFSLQGVTPLINEYGLSGWYTYKLNIGEFIHSCRR